MPRTHKIFYKNSPIYSLKSLASTLSIPEHQLINLKNSVHSSYIHFVKNVRGKDRNLVEPKPFLKTILKRINTRIFCHIEFPHYLHGGIKSTPPRDFYSNANAHSGAEEIIAIDIQQYFPSITKSQVFHVYKKLMNFSDDVSDVLTELTTLDNSLPQGSPTSSILANLIMFEKEYSLASAFENRGWVYTRLIDDITVSSKKLFKDKDKDFIFRRLYALLENYSFTLHPNKKFIYSRSNSQQLMNVTGLWLNRGTPRVSRQYRKQVGAKVNELKIQSLDKENLHSDKYHSLHSTVSGQVALLKRMGHARSNKLRTTLNSIQPIFSEELINNIASRIDKFCKKKNKKNTEGYIKGFYKYQHLISIIKRTHPMHAKSLQEKLNKVRPTMTLGELN